MLLDRVANVTERRAGADLYDAQPQALEGDFAQASRLQRRFAYLEHAAAVAVIAVRDHGHVEVDDVPILQQPVAGDAMADLMVHRRANRLWIWPVAWRSVVEWCWNAALNIHDVVVAELIQFPGGDSRFDVRRDEVEHLGRKATSDAHFFDFLRGLARYSHASRPVPR